MDFTKASGVNVTPNTPSPAKVGSARTQIPKAAQFGTQIAIVEVKDKKEKEVFAMSEPEAVYQPILGFTHGSFNLKNKLVKGYF